MKKCAVKASVTHNSAFFLLPHLHPLHLSRFLPQESPLGCSWSSLCHWLTSHALPAGEPGLTVLLRSDLLPGTSVTDTAQSFWNKQLIWSLRRRSKRNAPPEMRSRSHECQLLLQEERQNSDLFVCAVLDYPFIKTSLMHIIQRGGRGKSLNYNTFWLLGFLLHCHLRFFPHFCYLLNCNSEAINSVLIAYISITGGWKDIGCLSFLVSSPRHPTPSHYTNLHMHPS